MKTGIVCLSSLVLSDDNKEKYIENYRRAEGIALDKASILKKVVACVSWKYFEQNVAVIKNVNVCICCIRD